ncbi:hypothetical protein ACHAXS_007504 [Conticribra weissflogii]
MASSATSTSAGTESAKENDKNYLYIPSERDAHYRGNIARYLLDLHEEKATFDFCGGMMFQLVLTNKLQSHLQTIAANTPPQTDEQPKIHPSTMPRMSNIPDYARSSHADNLALFHGREIRKVPHANGGMGFVLQLSYADESEAMAAVDPQGWSSREIAGYDGWRHDANRQWRRAATYAEEGFETFEEEFGPEAFGLNHRFYLHYDEAGRMWLSAEDGCEGTPSRGRNLMGKLGGLLFGI